MSASHLQVVCVLLFLASAAASQSGDKKSAATPVLARPNAVLALDTAATPGQNGQNTTLINDFFTAPNCANGCTASVPQTYPFDADRSGDDRNIANVLPGTNQHLVDYRGGSESHTFGDPGAIGAYLPADAFKINVFSRRQTYDGNALHLRYDIQSPGYSLGTPNGGASGAPSGWLTAHGMLLEVNDFHAGIGSGIDMFLNKFGVGDFHNYWYVFGSGGFRAGADEMLQGLAMHVGEMAGPVFTGTVTASSAYKVTTTPLTGNKQQGVGRMLVDKSMPLASGCITAQGQMVDPSGKPLPITLFTLGCGAPALTPSTVRGRLAANAWNVPAIQSTGANTVTTPTQVPVTLDAGTAFQVGDLAVFAGDFHETAKVIAAAQPANGQQLVTFALRHTHSAGTVVMQSAYGAMGLDIMANDSPTMHYYLDVLGATTPTQIAAVVFAGGTTNLVDPINMSLLQYTSACNATSTGGVITFCVPPEQVSQRPLVGYPIITLSGMTNRAFNTQCINVRQAGPLVYPARLQCTSVPAIPDGTSPLGGNATIGDTGYGNSRFVLYPLAETLDVQDYSKTPPLVNGAFRLEPFYPQAFMPGHAVEQPHDYAAGYTAKSTGFGFDDPYAAQFSSVDDAGVTGYGINGSIYARYLKYGNPCSLYVTCGGSMSVPHGYQIGGVSTDLGGMDYAPWPSGKAFTHAGCDPQTGDCSNPFYNYDVFLGQGYQHHDLHLNWTPRTSTFDLGADHVTLSKAPTATGPLLYVCADPKTREIVMKAAACDAP